MSLYPQGRHVQGVKRSTHQVVIIIAVALAILCILLAVRLFTRGTEEVQLADVLSGYALQEAQKAQDVVTQISRLGGSTAYKQLAKTRQHLYAIRLLNTMASDLSGASLSLVPDVYIAEALEDITSGESAVISGQALDAQLAGLRESLGVILQTLSQS